MGRRVGIPAQTQPEPDCQKVCSTHVSWRRALTRTFGYELLSTGALLLLAPVLVSAPTGWMVLLVSVPLVAVNQLGRFAGEPEIKLRHDYLTGLLSRRALREAVDDLAVAAGHDAASGRARSRRVGTTAVRNQPTT